MDNHPIPQDVTGFQFKLIGNMTVKQFAYLATGAVLGWILLQLPIHILIKFPFAALSAILGIGLAYFPISGRPMDVMIGNYIKALLRPTQFVYEKSGGQIYYPSATSAGTQTKTPQGNFNPFPKDKLKAYLAPSGAAAKNKVDEKENIFLSSVTGLTATDTPRLNVQPTTLQPQSTPTSASEPIPEPIPEPQPQPIPQIKPARPILDFKKPIGIPIAPDFPNLIIGITRDPRGNPLANILVEVKDSQGSPVRAFKTNEVGRFASATPLANGTYTIVFEDPRGQNRFEITTINVSGQIIQPIEAVSIDMREELRRTLFVTQKN